MDMDVREDRCSGAAHKAPVFAHLSVKAMPKSLEILQQVHWHFLSLRHVPDSCLSSFFLPRICLDGPQMEVRQSRQMEVTAFLE